MVEAFEGLVAWVGDQPNTILEPGLSAGELDDAETALEVEFPALWRHVLRVVLPIDGDARKNERAWPDWPDWRLRNLEQLRSRVDAPVDGVLFDVEKNNFWWNAWGPAPQSPTERVKVAQKGLRDAARLVPIHGHQYVASASTSPVFSVVQCDMWIPAVTLADLPKRRGQDAVPIGDWPIGGVPFWSKLHAYSQVAHMDERFRALAQGGL